MKKFFKVMMGLLFLAISSGFAFADGPAPLDRPHSKGGKKPVDRVGKPRNKKPDPNVPKPGHNFHKERPSGPIKMRKGDYQPPNPHFFQQ